MLCRGSRPVRSRRSERGCFELVELAEQAEQAEPLIRLNTPSKYRERRRESSRTHKIRQ